MSAEVRQTHFELLNSTLKRTFKDHHCRRSGLMISHKLDSTQNCSSPGFGNLLTTVPSPVRVNPQLLSSQNPPFQPHHHGCSSHRMLTLTIYFYSLLSPSAWANIKEITAHQRLLMTMKQNSAHQSSPLCSTCLTYPILRWKIH